MVIPVSGFSGREKRLVRSDKGTIRIIRYCDTNALVVAMIPEIAVSLVSDVVEDPFTISLKNCRVVGHVAIPEIFCPGSQHHAAKLEWPEGRVGNRMNNP